MSAFIESTVKAIAAQVGAEQRHLRTERRCRFRGCRAAGAQGDRRPADLHFCRQRPAAQERIRIRAGQFSRTPASEGCRRGCERAIPFPAARMSRIPEQKRKIIGEEFIRVFEAAGRRARESAIPGPGDAVSRCHRIDIGARAFGGHQVAPQCRRPAARHEIRAR